MLGKKLYLKSISDGTLSGFLSGQEPRLVFHVSQFGYTKGPDKLRPMMPLTEKSNFGYPISMLLLFVSFEIHISILLLRIHPVWFNWETVKFLISMSHFFPTYTQTYIQTNVHTTCLQNFDIVLMDNWNYAFL